jgi:predicted DNA-binding transcriptional regulator YafY
MKELKNLSKNAAVSRPMLARIYYIDRLIASGSYPNTPKLAKAYEAGTATISRDIEFMRDRLGAPIEYDYQRRGYYYTKKTYRLPAAFTSADDMLALGMAKTLLSLYENTPIYGAARELVDTITAPLDDSRRIPWYEDRIAVPSVPSVLFSTETWHIIGEGLRENRVLAFEYRGTWYGGFQPRRVRPYQLLFDNGAWYLYGYAEERQGVRMFSLPRIQKICLLDDRFSLPADYDFRVRNEGSYFGVYSSEKKQRFSIAFYGEAALRIQERKWAADQVIKEIPPSPAEDGGAAAPGIVLSFTRTQYGKILELVMASGRDALPLEPADLADDWLNNLEGMQKRAKSLIRKK